MESTIFKKFRAGVFKGSEVQGPPQQQVVKVPLRKVKKFSGLLPTMGSSMYLRVNPQKVLPKIRRVQRRR